MTALLSSRRHKAAVRALLFASLFALALGVAGPASAAKSCGDRVIDDWYDNGRVDGTYDPHCYDDAIDSLPRDVLDYGSAKEDITRALQNRLNNEAAPPAQTDPSPDGPETPGSDPDDPTGTSGDGGGSTSPKPPDQDGPEAAPGDVDTASADSIPVPLLVLAGLALLLVAAGSAGYLTRRLQARRLPPSGS